MNEIIELESKYLVLKWVDICEALDEQKQKIFANLILDVDVHRKLKKNKGVNDYVVLNLNDEINLEYLVSQCHKKYSKLSIPGLYTVKVRNFSIDLVNAILKTKGE